MKKILLIILAVVAVGWAVSFGIYYFTYSSRKNQAIELEKEAREHLKRDSISMQNH